MDRPNEARPRRAVLVSGHYLLSKRKAGFHWLADALWRDGWHVTFVTVSFSHLSRVNKDHRFGYGLDKQANRLIHVDERLDTYAWFTAFHPPNKLPPAVDLALTVFFRSYAHLAMPGLEPVVQEADLVIFESMGGLLLFDRFRKVNPKARFVYRVSDDLRLLKAPLIVRQTEDRIAPRFDLISVTSPYSQQRFAGLPNVRLHHHGIDPRSFEGELPDPYGDRWETDVVFVGNSHFDYGFIELAPPQFPTWGFHVIGPIANLPRMPNVIAYGEIPFAETIPYLQHADIGLQIRAAGPSMEHLTDSLKVIQYTWVGLPVVAPDFLASKRPNVITYHPGDATSMREALLRARAYDRSSIMRDGIQTWTDIARELAGPLAAVDA
jgi:2-beta-glucuronyltransferase